MALYALSDLHLSFGADKPMHIFKGWDDYEERIRRNWCRLVTPDDAVALPGDLSWAMKLPDTLADFRFLQALPGEKYLFKGNHDLWWTSRRKMEDFLAQNGLTTLHFVHNNAYAAGPVAICGSRGWSCEGGAEDARILLREAGRLRLSLEAAAALGHPPAVFLHYPPVGRETDDSPLVEVLRAFGVTDVYYGHLHGPGALSAPREVQGIRLHLVSCDCVDFTPVPVRLPAP